MRYLKIEFFRTYLRQKKRRISENFVNIHFTALDYYLQNYRIIPRAEESILRIFLTYSSYKSINNKAEVIREKSFRF